MKIISIGTDRKIFEKNSAVGQRNAEYGKFTTETYVIVFTKKSAGYSNDKYQISKNVFAYPTNSSSVLFYIWDAFKIAKKVFNQDSIVTVGDSFETGVVGVLTKLFLGLPLHVQIHTDLMHKYFRSLSILNGSRFFISEFILRYADRVRVVSERVKKSIEKFSQNIDVLPIKTEIVQGQSLEIKKPFPFTLLMVCRLEKEKNIEMILQVIKNLENNRDIGLCIVGDGSQMESLKYLAKKLEISDKIFFAGWQNNLAPYYKMADVFVSTSLYEGYGISTIEAAYFEKPLILSETGVAGDVFQENASAGNYGSAFICDAKDEACFTKNILKVYKDKNLARNMGQSAKLSVEKHLGLRGDYFKEYVDSVLKTAKDFKKRNFIVRIFDFGKTVFKSFIALRYLMCGGVSATVNISSLYIFTDVFGIWYLYSSIFAFVASLVISFALQKFIVFKDIKIHKMYEQFSRFFVVTIFGVITNTVLVYVFVDFLKIWYIWSQIIAGIFIMFQNFLLYKFFIFNKNK